MRKRPARSRVRRRPRMSARASSIKEFAGIILSLRRRWFPRDPYPEIWFRGVNDSSLPLLPGAYWRRRCPEESLVLSFRNMAVSLLSTEPADEWEWYYLMQHYGLPTRLLDWTEQPLIALYFACITGRPRKAPCVWVMDPLALNRLTGDEAIVVPESDGPTKYWLPSYCGKHLQPYDFSHADWPGLSRRAQLPMRDNRQPLAIFPKRHNPRIVAQRGVFTVHGTDPTPIDTLPILDRRRRDSRLAKIVIPAGARLSLLRDLWAVGVNRTAIFPEPQSVADDLVRLYRVR